MGKRQTTDTIPPYAAADLILAEIRARMLAAADDAIAGYDPSDYALDVTAQRFGMDVIFRIEALVTDLGMPDPPEGLSVAYRRFFDESIQRPAHGVVAKASDADAALDAAVRSPRRKP